MTVRELIALLSSAPSDSTVRIYDPTRCDTYGLERVLNVDEPTVLLKMDYDERP